MYKAFNLLFVRSFSTCLKRPVPVSAILISWWCLRCQRRLTVFENSVYSISTCIVLTKYLGNMYLPCVCHNLETDKTAHQASQVLHPRYSGSTQQVLSTHINLILPLHILEGRAFLLLPAQCTFCTTCYSQGISPFQIELKYFQSTQKVMKMAAKRLRESVGWRGQWRRGLRFNWIEEMQELSIFYIIYLIT